MGLGFSSPLSRKKIGIFHPSSIQMVPISPNARKKLRARRRITRRGGRSPTTTTRRSWSRRTAPASSWSPPTPGGLTAETPSSSPARPWGREWGAAQRACNRGRLGSLGHMCGHWAHACYLLKVVNVTPPPPPLRLSGWPPRAGLTRRRSAWPCAARRSWWTGTCQGAALPSALSIVTGY
jgi:hypothetical protein